MQKRVELTPGTSEVNKMFGEMWLESASLLKTAMDGWAIAHTTEEE